MEDAEIIDLYWARDQRAIDETHGKYGGFLAGIAWNILRSHGDAEECVNDTYLRTWNAIPPARPSAFRAWRGGDGMEVLLGELGDCVPTPRGTEKALEDQEIAALISDFLRRLSKEHRAIFLRRYWYGQSVAEIAEALGCGQGKVKSALFRTRKALRTYLEQEEVLL